MKRNLQIFLSIAERISMTTKWKRKAKDTLIQDGFLREKITKKYRFAVVILYEPVGTDSQTTRQTRWTYEGL